VDCIEINSTFYRPPEKTTSEIWAEQVPKEKPFFFTAKLHQRFTHEGQIDSELMRQYKDGFAPLLEAGLLRCLLMQFRYDFTASQDNRRYLAKLIEQVRDVCPIAVELRHSSWQQPGVLDELEQQGVSVCSIDYPTGSDSFVLNDRAVGAAGYMRLHGRNAAAWFAKSTRDERYDYYYSPEELREIAARIQRLAAHCRSYTVIANNHYKGAEVANALELKFLLTGIKQRVPDGLLARYPSLSRIALSSGLFDGSAE
jgi:uncharacterized protein YecE (DUF72 family)